MEAVEQDDGWELRFPDISAPEYPGFDGTLEQAERAGVPIKVYKRVRARELFDKIVLQAHHNGEPGLLFLDTANRSNPLSRIYELEATNPCGEQWLGPYENCCLGSINLAQHFAPNGGIDWEKLSQSIELATRFLDDVVQVNAYVPAVPQLKEAAFRARRLGLGIMGLADLMYHVGVRYGSEESLDLGAQVMEFIRYHAMLTSNELAKERGPFPAIEGSIYDPKHLKWQPPQPLTPYQHDWGRPPVDWETVCKGIREHGIRNAAQTTVAPTGTIATVAGIEGYGCEPVFALAYTRNVNDNGKNLQLSYLSPLFEQALDTANIDAEIKQRVIDQILEQGTCQQSLELPDHIRNVFVVSSDISAEEHVYLQAALQAFVDNSLSKTVNFPPDTEPEEVATAYQLAWRLGCKGITVYVAGSRQKVVLETNATAKEKALTATEEAMMPAAETSQQLTIWPETKKPRPRQLPGMTYNINTPLGKAFITINENGNSQPFEVFINTAKAGSETAAISEAIGRLLSYILRMASPLIPRERLEETVRQLSGLGGERSLGFGPNRVRSLPDGVAQVMAEYLSDTSQEAAETPATTATSFFSLEPAHPATHKTQPTEIVCDLCPECGQATLINEEGCRKCHSCGYSEC
jgi:ribonucleoside-diphosphate reductase alpha chain